MLLTDAKAVLTDLLAIAKEEDISDYTRDQKDSHAEMISHWRIALEIMSDLDSTN